MNKLINLAQLQAFIKPVNGYSGEELQPIYQGRHLKVFELVKIEDADKYNFLAFTIVNRKEGETSVLQLGYNSDMHIDTQVVTYDVIPTENQSVIDILNANKTTIESTIFAHHLDDAFGLLAITLANYQEQPEEEASSPSITEGTLLPKRIYLTIDEFASFFNMEDEPQPVPDPEE